LEWLFVPRLVLPKRQRRAERAVPLIAASGELALPQLLPIQQILQRDALGIVHLGLRLVLTHLSLVGARAALSAGGPQILTQAVR